MNRIRGMTIALLCVGYVLITQYPYTLEFPHDPAYALPQFLAGFPLLIFGGTTGWGSTDFLRNVLFYFPFGILLYYALGSRERSRAVTVLQALMWGGALSFCIELSQIFFSGRHPSARDVVGNTLGTGCGAILVALWPARLVERFGRLWGTLERAHIPLVIVLLYGALPLMFSLANTPWPNFRNWDDHASFQLGNEATLNRPWLGKIYLVAIYSRALAPTEIAEYFHMGYASGSTKRREQSGLIAYHTFHEGSGTVVHDMSTVEPPLHLTFLPGPGIRWLSPSHGIEIVQPGILKNRDAVHKLFNRLRVSNELSIEVWMAPESITQRGPARIVSFSGDTGSSNFILGQQDANIHFRLRTPLTGRDGASANLRTGDKFLTRDTFHIVATYAKGLERLYVNGREYASRLDLTKDVIIGFGRVRNSTNKLAYSFFYFFPVSFLCAILFFRQSRGMWPTILMAAAIPISLVSLTELVQSMAFHRGIDAPLIGYGVLAGLVGAGIGMVFARGASAMK